MKKNSIAIIALIGIAMQSCMSDMRSKTLVREGVSIESEQKGKQLLATAWEKHGFANLEQHHVYQVKASDEWKGFMGKMGKPWPEAKSDMIFKYAVKTFDSKITYLNGKRKGLSAGLQSWKYYEQEANEELQFMKLKKRPAFGLSAYHYFFEMLDRIKRAPIISYMGEEEFRGKKYDLIFATWEKPAPHMEHDQYVLWIGKESGLLEYAVYSLRDNYLKMPGYKAFYGSIEFRDLRAIDGVLIPFEQYVYLNSPHKKQHKHVHKLKVHEFSFDSFDINELYPDKSISKMGDSK